LWGTTVPVANLFALAKAARLVKETRSDLIHAQTQEASVFGARLASVSRLPYVVSVHTFGAPRRLAVPHGAKVVAVSQALREYLVNEMGVPKEAISVVPNGVDAALYRIHPRPFSRADQIPVVGSIGRLEEVRGFESFIRAARMVVDAGCSVEFLIVGAGSDEIRLRNLVSVLGLGESMTFVTESSDYETRLLSLDVVVVCPVREGFGMVVLEAMACGRPVIASAVGGIYDIVKDGETGLLVQSRDARGTAEKIIALLRNPVEAERLGRNARAVVEEKFTVDEVVRQTEDVYSRAVEDGAAHRQSLTGGPG
jgi:glycosyltransferase involved in cell wall biosynthesis